MNLSHRDKSMNLSNRDKKPVEAAWYPLMMSDGERERWSGSAFWTGSEWKDGWPKNAAGFWNTGFGTADEAFTFASEQDF